MRSDYDEIIQEIAEIEGAIKDWTAHMETRLIVLRRRLQALEAENV